MIFTTQFIFHGIYRVICIRVVHIESQQCRLSRKVEHKVPHRLARTDFHCLINCACRYIEPEYIVVITAVRLKIEQNQLVGLV